MPPTSFRQYVNRHMVKNGYAPLPPKADLDTYQDALRHMTEYPQERGDYGMQSILDFPQYLATARSQAGVQAMSDRANPIYQDFAGPSEPPAPPPPEALGHSAAPPGTVSLSGLNWAGIRKIPGLIGEGVSAVKDKIVDSTSGDSGPKPQNIYFVGADAKLSGRATKRFQADLKAGVAPIEAYQRASRGQFGRKYARSVAEITASVIPLPMNTNQYNNIQSGPWASESDDTGYQVQYTYLHDPLLYSIPVGNGDTGRDGSSLDVMTVKSRITLFASGLGMRGGAGGTGVYYAWKSEVSFLAVSVVLEGITDEAGNSVPGLSTLFSHLAPDIEVRPKWHSRTRIVDARRLMLKVGAEHGPDADHRIHDGEEWDVSYDYSRAEEFTYDENNLSGTYSGGRRGPVLVTYIVRMQPLEDTNAYGLNNPTPLTSYPLDIFCHSYNRLSWRK